ncbi:DUF4913 domain-containing protein [Couchioplanes caeruleus subsp. caeruleus]|uniref:DUF4913 domain-containing protein n=1 Tax=Couchioplanes caeruleus subsp. caeruleus TaxID=56427 RepID=A0A1K0FPC5_9ACTN|nr:DUF4913 domain-containing protein [Couchioplanes caeruleus subsp. caeruleus]
MLDQLAGARPAVTDALPAEVDDALDGSKEPSAARPLFSDLEAFLRRYLAPVVERRLTVGAASGVNWCPEWWQHPEAISRLYALWRAWETLRAADPDTGMSIWWRDHFDPHFAVLTGEYGPFGKCSPDRGHVATTPLPLTPAPPDVLAQLPDAEL